MESFCIPFREIPHTTKLFSSFLDDFAQVSSFYAHPPSAAGIDAAAREVRLSSDVRRSVVEILRQQNRDFSPGGQLDSAAAGNLERLASGAVAIVTGQQVGLFSGPAFSLYKALSILRCAEETTRRGIDAVPIFWLATEDHDLAEVNHSFFNTRNGLSRYELRAKDADSGRPVGEVVLGEEIEPLVSAAAQTLEGHYAENAARALREAYTPGETYGSAFGKLMARLLAGRGIIFIDPSDVRLHRLAAPVFLQALEQADSLREALLARSKELTVAGFHDQVKVTHETTLLFRKVGGRREPLRRREGKFLAGEAEFSRDELASAIESAPDSFTPSAILRPVVQDTLLPTAAYFGGPAEVAYLAQSEIAYRRILGRMPAILPRASFTIIESPVPRILEHYGLEFRDVLAGPQHLRAKMEQKSLPAELSTRFDASEQAVRATLKALEGPLERLDSTLLEALEGTERRVLHQFEQLRGKIARAENFRSGVLDRKERILLDSLYPDGGLQERTHSALPLLASVGPTLLDDLTSLASVADSTDGRSCATQHRVLIL